MLKVHLIAETVEHGDIYTVCGRYGTPLTMHTGHKVYGSMTGRTRFNAVTKDQKPEPGYSAVPVVDCEACLRKSAH